MNKAKRRSWENKEYHYLCWRYPGVPRKMLRQWAREFVNGALRK